MCINWWRNVGLSSNGLLCSAARTYNAEAEGKKTNREVWSTSKREQTTGTLLRHQINSTRRLCFFFFSPPKGIRKFVAAQRHQNIWNLYKPTWLFIASLQYYISSILICLFFSISSFIFLPHWLTLWSVFLPFSIFIFVFLFIHCLPSFCIIMQYLC